MLVLVVLDNGGHRLEPVILAGDVQKAGGDFALIPVEALSFGTVSVSYAAIEIIKEKFCRYIHIRAVNFGLIPSGKPGAGNPAWLFVDEIEVQ